MGQGGIGIDEDAHPENAILEGGEELSGGIRRAVAPALRPEVDPEGMDPELSETVGVVDGGDTADLEGRSSG